MALDTTVGGSSADSYATIAEGTAILWNAPADWTGASTATQEGALKEAAILIDKGLYRSAKNASEQALRFPSTYMVDGTGTKIIPQEIKRAQVFLALELIRDAEFLYGSGGGSEVVESVNIAGSGSVKFANSGTTDSDTWEDIMPAHVLRELRPHLLRSGAETSYRYDPVSRSFG